ncbi:MULTISPECIES: hypothetical protein [unclassified Pseudomonas]|uniref:hypothetical protein n=1 Tax=unclassified Pseudomonas TaxID=196821 RepID=UPI0025E02AA3|nr:MULTISPECIES: hypothetical protein [unclassified Pseudomonas]
MTQVIEIVVIGATGSGKSHVLELIDRALHSEYGQHVQVTSHELSLERFMGSPGSKPNVADTIFNLREKGSRDSSKNGDMKVSIDTSELTSAIDKIEAIQGEPMSFMFDPLEQAIESTARVMRDERDSALQTSRLLGSGPTLIYQRLSLHLDSLLAEQLKRLTNNE